MEPADTALAHFLAEVGGAAEVLRIGAALYYFFWTRCQRYGIHAVRTALARPTQYRPPFGPGPASLPSQTSTD
jgi:hypothetical protein